MKKRTISRPALKLNVLDILCETGPVAEEPTIRLLTAELDALLLASEEIAKRAA